MKMFKYLITDEIGIHARPAGLLVKEAGKYKSLIKITNQSNQKTAEANKLFGIMSLGVKCGDTVEVSIVGEDEDVAHDGLKIFFENNL